MRRRKFLNYHKRHFLRKQKNVLKPEPIKPIFSQSQSATKKQRLKNEEKSC